MPPDKNSDFCSNSANPDSDNRKEVRGAVKNPYGEKRRGLSCFTLLCEFEDSPNDKTDSEQEDRNNQPQALEERIDMAVGFSGHFRNLLVTPLELRDLRSYRRYSISQQQQAHDKEKNTLQ